MPACHLKPNDKKAFISAVGQELVQKHGKRKYYRPEQVRRAVTARGYNADISCWAFCTYCTPEDFDAVHAAAGEVCDYAAMKAEVLSDLASGGTFSWLDIDLSWLDWPDIDLSAIFEWFDLS